MVPDYSFFALLFVLAQALAPGATQELTWVNGAHPDELITWTREGDGWTLKVNDHTLGAHRRQGDEVTFLLEGAEAPERYRIDALMAPFQPSDRTVSLRGRFAPTVLSLDRAGRAARLRDPDGRVLGVPLTLRSR